MPTVNVALIPPGSMGFGGERLQVTTELPSGPPGTGGAFRIACAFSHMNFDDPIVFPGQIGRSHLHSFFGNTTLNANTTAANITTAGNSTCNGGTINRSGYWVPSIIDTLDGRPIAPSEAVIYYKTGDNNTPEQLMSSLPPGLRMISGNPTAKEVSAEWLDSPAVWSCERAGTGEQYNKMRSIPACADGDTVLLGIEFPNCWDGVNLDSPDHKSHMFYGRGACPASHPKAIPDIAFNVRWPAKGAARWRLSSDNYEWTKPGGYSVHADWFNGWKPAISDAWLKGCVAAHLDCHAHLLGDGRAMY
jgi:Domain of unknown function (DUF1996)